jgi:hypothetical protein
VRMKVLPHVMRNINEFNIPAGNSHGYEVLYFGVNLILMFDYRFAFDIEVKNSYDEIQILIVSRKDIPGWKENNDIRSSKIKPYYDRSGDSMIIQRRPIFARPKYMLIVTNL